MKKLVFSRHIIMYMMFTLIMFVVLMNKANFHVDEIYTYTLSNNVGNTGIEITDGISYMPSESAYLNSMVVNEGERFNYSNVWLNQANDVHPPLYYALVHTICSLFPGHFSLWYAGAVNIFFALMTLWTIRKIAYELTNNETIVSVVSVFYIISAGMLSTITFLRMYVMAAFFVSFITLIFVKAVGRKLTWHFFALLIFVSVTGTLTHYFFTIYLFFLCLVFGIWLLAGKHYKDAFVFCASMGIAASSTLLIFPSAYNHILGGGYRGAQSIDNFLDASISNYWDNIKSFYSFIDKPVFGGMISYIFVALFTIAVLRKISFKKKVLKLFGEKEIQEKTVKWLILVLPSICYLLLVSKIAVYITDRYISPIYAVSVVWIISLVCLFAYKWFNEKYCYIVIGVILSVMTVNGWHSCIWETSYKASKELLEATQEYAEQNAVYVYGEAWKVQPSFLQVIKHKSVTFFKNTNIGAMYGIKNNLEDKLVVYIDNSLDAQGIINKVYEAYPLLNSYKKLGSFGYSSSYYLWGEGIQTQKYRIYNYYHDFTLGSSSGIINSGESVGLSVNDSVVQQIQKDNGQYSILMIGNLALDIKGGSLAEGSSIQLYVNNNTNAQKWRLFENDDGTMTIFSANDDLVLAYDERGNVYLSRYNSNDNSQKWRFEQIN